MKYFLIFVMLFVAKNNCNEMVKEKFEETEHSSVAMVISALGWGYGIYSSLYRDHISLPALITAVTASYPLLLKERKIINNIAEWFGHKRDQYDVPFISWFLLTRLVLPSLYVFKMRQVSAPIIPAPVMAPIAPAFPIYSLRSSGK